MNENDSSRHAGASDPTRPSSSRAIGSADRLSVEDEAAIAQRARLLVSQLRHAPVVVPDDFEARLLAQLRTDQTLLDLLELLVSGTGRALSELLAVLFGALPTRPVPAL